MMKKLTEQALVEAVKQGLDSSVDQLDGVVRERLQRARLQALEQPRYHLSDFLSGWSLSPGFATAAVVTLAASLWVLPNATDSLTSEAPVMVLNPDDVIQEVAMDAAPAVNVMEVLMSNEEMDFLENLEIYEWMDAEYG
jgi:hypothetical protein